MKNIQGFDSDKDIEMLPEYDFDYTKAKPNRFAQKPGMTVILDPDVAEVFTTSGAVNRALRAIISAIPTPVGEGRKAKPRSPGL